MEVNVDKANCLVGELATELNVQLANLVAIPREITTMKEEMRANHAEMTANIVNLTIAIHIMNIETQNNRKRILNSCVISTDEPLHKLVNSTTAENIPNFPNNIAAISTMTLPQIKSVIAALGHPLPQNSSLAGARKFLRVELGLSREPQYFPVRL